MANNRLVSHTADRAVRETIQKKIDAKIDQKLQKSDANKAASAFEALTEERLHECSCYRCFAVVCTLVWRLKQPENQVKK